MDVREKLVELIEKARLLASETLGSMNRGFGGWYADYLIAHGATVQEWISASEPPQKGGEYLCRCIVNDMDDMPFYMVLRYYIVDENPHFQHETMGGMKVTHWKPFDRLEKHEPMEMRKQPKGE